jgi:aldehyde dehydrogenase (NAD+)
MHSETRLSQEVWERIPPEAQAYISRSGYKMSGYGRDSDLQQLDEYLNVKTVWIKTA